MSRRDDATRLRHMLDYCREAAQLSAGRSRGELDSDRLFNLAMVRVVEIIGEAAGRISEETRAKHAAIPWSEIIGARNRLVHGYDQIDFDILWHILAVDVPVLIPQLEQIAAKP